MSISCKQTSSVGCLGVQCGGSFHYSRTVDVGIAASLRAQPVTLVSVTKHPIWPRAGVKRAPPPRPRFSAISLWPSPGLTNAVQRPPATSLTTDRQFGSDTAWWIQTANARCGLMCVDRSNFNPRASTQGWRVLLKGWSRLAIASPLLLRSVGEELEWCELPWLRPLAFLLFSLEAFCVGSET